MNIKVMNMNTCCDIPDHYRSRKGRAVRHGKARVLLYIEI